MFSSRFGISISDWDCKGQDCFKCKTCSHRKDTNASVWHQARMKGRRLDGLQHHYSSSEGHLSRWMLTTSEYLPAPPASPDSFCRNIFFSLSGLKCAACSPGGEVKSDISWSHHRQEWRDHLLRWEAVALFLLVFLTSLLLMSDSSSSVWLLP